MELTLKSLVKDYKNLTVKKDLSGKKALEAVKRNGYALQYVREQTPEICLEAVKQDGYALQYVREQTPEICLEAVKRNGYALQYVEPEIFGDLEDNLERTVDDVLSELNESDRKLVQEVLR